MDNNREKIKQNFNALRGEELNARRVSLGLSESTRFNIELELLKIEKKKLDSEIKEMISNEVKSSLKNKVENFVKDKAEEKFNSVNPEIVDFTDFPKTSAAVKEAVKNGFSTKSPLDKILLALQEDCIDKVKGFATDVVGQDGINAFQDIAKELQALHELTQSKNPSEKNKKEIQSCKKNIETNLMTLSASTLTTQLGLPKFLGSKGMVKAGQLFVQATSNEEEKIEDWVMRHSEELIKVMLAILTYTVTQQVTQQVKENAPKLPSLDTMKKILEFIQNRIDLRKVNEKIKKEEIFQKDMGEYDDKMQPLLRYLGVVIETGKVEIPDLKKANSILDIMNNKDLKSINDMQAARDEFSKEIDELFKELETKVTETNMTNQSSSLGILKTIDEKVDLMLSYDELIKDKLFVKAMGFEKDKELNNLSPEAITKAEKIKKKMELIQPLLVEMRASYAEADTLKKQLNPSGLRRASQAVTFRFTSKKSEDINLVLAEKIKIQELLYSGSREKIQQHLYDTIDLVAMLVNKIEEYRTNVSLKEDITLQQAFTDASDLFLPSNALPPLDKISVALTLILVPLTKIKTDTGGQIKSLSDPLKTLKSVILKQKATTEPTLNVLNSLETDLKKIQAELEKRKTQENPAVTIHVKPNNR